MTNPADLTPETLLRAYAAGVFPMAESRDTAELFWVNPRMRGVFPLDRFRLSRSLRRRLMRQDYTVTADQAFAEVVTACADRDETWINPGLERLYHALHTRGAAHSIEVWQDGALAGGVFGVTLGGAFFGESMFSRRTNGSKIALAYLVDLLNRAGFILFDTQFITPHLASLGAVELPRSRYMARLAAALEVFADFNGPDPFPGAQGVIQRNTQTS